MKKYFGMVVSCVLTLLALIVGAGANVIMADAIDVGGAGADEGGNANGGRWAGGTGGTGFKGEGYAGDANENVIVGSPNGIAAEGVGRSLGDPDFYLNDVDKRIVKIRPFSTPIDQISRYAKTEQVDSFTCKYYSSGTRPIKTTLTAAVTGDETQPSVALSVADASMFTVDDTILVLDGDGQIVNASVDVNGNAVTAQTTAEVPALMLCVCGRDTNNNPVVFAVNGTLNEATGEPTGVPDLEEGSILIRMGKAAGELDVQTGRFVTRPKASYNYCQNFMIQIEQSTFDKIAAKEVNWDFSDLEEDGIYDMRLAQEFSYLFGSSQCIHHVTKDGMAQWFTRGIWWQAGKDLTIGEDGVIEEDDLVDFSKDVFDGVDAGNRRVLLAGSGLMAALDKIRTDKIVQKEFFNKWHLDFTELSTTFGKIDVLHCQVLNQVGKSNEGFVLDPDFLSKKVHVSWGRNVLDLKKAGVRNTDAVVIQEVACLCLRNAKAHARVALG